MLIRKNVGIWFLFFHQIIPMVQHSAYLLLIHSVTNMLHSLCWLAHPTNWISYICILASISISSHSDCILMNKFYILRLSTVSLVRYFPSLYLPLSQTKSRCPISIWLGSLLADLLPIYQKFLEFIDFWQ